MSILGHDIDGRPLRAGDKVVLVSATSPLWHPLVGSMLTITGLSKDNPIGHHGLPMVTVAEVACTSATSTRHVRKLHNDHRPADESFTEMMDKLKGEVV